MGPRSHPPPVACAPPATATRVREAMEQEGVDLAGAGLDLSDPGDEPSDDEPGWERQES